jgi:hypothetical protein
MSGEYQLLLMIAGMHVLGLVCVAVLVWVAVRDGQDELPGHGDSGSDGGWGNEPRRPPEPSDRPWGGVPLPDATQARLRLRDDRRLRDLEPRRERRPSREPRRAPTPVQ